MEGPLVRVRAPDERVGVVVITRDRRRELLRSLEALVSLPEAPPRREHDVAFQLERPGVLPTDVGNMC